VQSGKEVKDTLEERVAKYESTLPKEEQQESQVYLLQIFFEMSMKADIDGGKPKEEKFDVPYYYVLKWSVQD